LEEFLPIVLKSSMSLLWTTPKTQRVRDVVEAANCSRKIQRTRGAIEAANRFLLFLPILKISTPSKNFWQLWKISNVLLLTVFFLLFLVDFCPVISGSLFYSAMVITPSPFLERWQFQARSLILHW
jgi:hypothetical protein